GACLVASQHGRRPAIGMPVGTNRRDVQSFSAIFRLGTHYLRNDRRRVVHTYSSRQPARRGPSTLPRCGIVAPPDGAAGTRHPHGETMTAEQWWRGAVIYQIYPRSYMDTNGDGVGDLPGIIARLDHVASLGVDAIWISPFFKSPMADFGYDIADYRDVDPLFGSLDDFDRLLAKAHSLGIKVMIDQVFSHTSDQHEWFRESRQSRDNP